MKRYLALLLTLFCVVALVACNTVEDAEQAYFVGKVIEKYEASCLLEVTNNGNQYFASGDAVVVNTNVEGCPDYSVGDFLRVGFDGTVAESYPLQIPKVFSIDKTDEMGNAIQ